MKTKLQLFFFTLFFSANLIAQPGTNCWRVISAGTNFSLGIKIDGTMWGWGANGNLLGLSGITVNQNSPVQIGTANDWATVSAGDVHSLAVKVNGTLWAWGNGQFGQLGNGLFNSATWTVTQVGTANDWLKVSAGNRFSLATKTTGTLWSWGLNSFGQLGQGNLTNLNLPAQVGIASNWLKIDAGNQHSLAIDNSGFVYGWGDNAMGQLGNGTNTSSLVPILVSSSITWSEVSAGFDHSMFLSSFGFLFTAGNNINGQLCNGTNTASNVMIAASASGAQYQYIAISAGNNFSLAIKNDNTLWSGGLNSLGELGLGNNTSVNQLNQVGTSNTWFLISAGYVHSLAMDTSTFLYSTGRNLEGALGIGNFNFSYNLLQSVSCPTTPLGTQEVIENTMNATVYPNPFNDSFHVDFTTVNTSKVVFRLTNIQGQLISESTMENVNEMQTKIINLSNQSSGIYFLTLTTENDSYSVKVIKK